LSTHKQANSTPPFHRGEQQIQSRVGVREKVEAIGQRIVRDFMPEQHREFFAQLPFLVVGMVDAAGAPWASMLTGGPGFISSPDPRSLRIDARFRPGDPLYEALRVGADVGLLGIEFHTRRRNRVNGPIVASDARGFLVQVAQSFGNCPKYINERRHLVIPPEGPRSLLPSRVLDRLDTSAGGLIEAADTLFIATHHAEAKQSRSTGADVSHRGGPRGFVRIDGPRTLTWPDYVGNYLFNTLGNLAVNPRAGLLFPGFERHDRLHLTGRVEIIWDGDEVDAVAGAQRLLRFHVDRVVHLGQRG